MVSLKRRTWIHIECNLRVLQTELEKLRGHHQQLAREYKYLYSNVCREMYTVLAISIRTHSNGEQRYIPEQLETARSHSTPAAVLASTTLRKQNINGIMILHEF